MLPEDVNWSFWKDTVRQLLRDKACIYSRIDKRFIYGELRLNRLNNISLIRSLRFKTYLRLWNGYGSFLRGNLAVLAFLTVFSGLILAAVQVGQGTSLASNASFEKGCRVFTIFSFVELAASSGVLLLALIYASVGNLLHTLKHRRRRDSQILQSSVCTM